MATSLLAITLAVLVTIIGTFAALFVKLGSKTFSFSPLKLIKNYKLMVGVALYVLGNILFIFALKGGDLSVLFPLLSIGYIWIIPVSVKFLGEKVTNSKLAGIAFILVGVSLIGIS